MSDRQTEKTAALIAQSNAWGRIFRIVSDAVNPGQGANLAELTNAEAFPLKFVGYKIMQAHKLRRVTALIDRQLANLFSEIDINVWEGLNNKPLPMSARGAFQIGYALGAEGLAPPVTKIETIRKALGLSQSEVASKIGSTQKSLWQWESGAVFPRHSILIKLADALGCSVKDLID